MNENQISRVIVEAAIAVHRTLGGPGLLESIYEEALAWELIQRGFVEKQNAVPNFAPSRLGVKELEK